jgi:aminoglycoside phosphotransferase (APT) family kinase protein
MARLLRRYHDAVRHWQVGDDLVWYDGSSGTGDGTRLVLHGDFGPWNLVWSGTEPVGVLDWEHARVGLPIEDLAYLVEWTAPFCDDEQAADWRHFPAPPDRRRRVAIAAAAYGVATSGLVEAVLAGQQRMLDQVERMAAEGHERQQATIAEGWHDLARQRHSWCVEHRDLFEE